MNTLRTTRFLMAGCLVGVFWMVGCKAKAMEDSGYLQDSSKMKKDPNDPFNRSWQAKPIDETTYTEILVRPVNIHYVKAQNMWEGSSVRSLGMIHKDLEDLAAYTQKAFIEAAEKDPKHRFKVVQTAGPKTAVLELAIVQLVPSKAALNAIGLVGIYVSGAVMAVEVVGGDMTHSQDQGKGVIAIEGRIRDGATGRTIFMFADRERGQTAVINIAEYTWYEPEKRIVDIWAKDLIELANTPGKQKIKEPATFELMVW